MDFRLVILMKDKYKLINLMASNLWFAYFNGLRITRNPKNELSRQNIMNSTTLFTRFGCNL